MIVITFPAGLAGCLEPKRGSTFWHYTEVIVRTCSVSHPSPYIYASNNLGFADFIVAN